MKQNYFQKKHYLVMLTVFLFSLITHSQVIITGVFDGPLPGGLPKGVELYVTEDIADLSIYGIGSANNGTGSNGEEFTFPAVAAASGDFIYVSSEIDGFFSFFGFEPNYTSSAVNINGDDAIELFKSSAVIDVFGDINVDGTGQPWDHLDGWAYRKNSSGPDGSVFVLENWTFSGINALEGGATNSTTASPFPVATYGGGFISDTEAPSIPTNLMAENTTSTSTMLSWQAASDNIGVIAYQIYDNTTLVAFSTDVTFTITGLTPETTYNFIVKAIDAAGNSSEASNSISVTTLVNTTEPTFSGLIISGVVDGPLSGGVPKAIEFYVTQDIADLSLYGFGSANNGGGSDGQEFTFSGSAKAGDFIYVASEEPGFTSFFGFAPNFTSGAASINGDDAIELFLNNTVVDVFGDINMDGSGEAWDYLDGWAYRKDDTGPDGSTFMIENWVFSGIDALDGVTENSTATNPFPTMSYGPDLIITGVVDGPLSGGVPKVIEFYAKQDIADLSLYGFGSANNGGGSDGQEFTFSGSASAGDFIYVASETIGFNNYFGFTPNFTSNAAEINGDDAIELFFKGNVIDVFGDINVDGSGEAWDYLDGWAYRNNSTGPDGSLFVIENWTFSGINALDGTTTNTTFPIGTYGGDAVAEPIALITIAEARAESNTGKQVKVTGVLTVADEFSGSAYLQDATGGIAVFDALVHGEGIFKIGDSITITGTRSIYNGQIQISPVTEVVNNGLSNQVIEPLLITLNELQNHPGELVKISKPNFPKPGDMLFGNSNYILTDANGFGELRINNNVDDIVGLAQPENCDEVIGVVGRYFDIYQLMPRMSSDIACAEKYVSPTLPNNISRENTLDIATWNIEWFGDEANSPAAGNVMSDAIQKEAVKAVLNELKADVLAVQEISDDALFAELVSELPGYDYVLSPAVSYPNGSDVKQKVGFIYNTATVNVTNTKVLLETIHPYYNGGDDSALVNYPSTPDRFYASGRLPFLMTANVQINGQTEEYNFVALHARANGSTDSQSRYDMRKYDVEVLKDSLDMYYPKANLVLLGDYNDDLDETVADNVSSTMSTYFKYTADSENYNMVTKALSDQGFRSYVFQENMIDHIAISNELTDNYLVGSEVVHYEFYNNMYANSTSDHFPVSIRMQLKTLSIDDLVFSETICFEGVNGKASISVSGGVAPYSYKLNENIVSSNSVEGLTSGNYLFTVTDAIGNSVTEEFTIVEAWPLELTTTEGTTVYFGYEAQSCTNLEVTEVLGGVAPYTYLWSTGDISENIKVCPEETTDYIVTVTDANGCSIEKSITVEVVDVVCDNKRDIGVQMCYKGKEICINPNWVNWYLYKGATLGACDDGIKPKVKFNISPNPFLTHTNIQFTSNVDTTAELKIYDFRGKLQKSFTQFIQIGDTEVRLDLSDLNCGLYFLNTMINGIATKTNVLIKRYK
ncbi:fibronectin type III domain-containing protein [Mariniflexile sp.]|uniref:fibronectin type III domain-containing protein n=1 Tax=Mariniflexile sp. TaxID=1979402 RepID=UPI0035620ADE